MNIKRKSKLRKKNNSLYKIISAILIISSVVFISILFYIDLLPTKYFMVLLLSILFFDIFNVSLINIKRLKQKIKKTLSSFVIAFSLIMLVMSFYIGKTMGVMLSNEDSKYKIENYSIIALKSSDYNKIIDIKNEKIGYVENSNGTEEVIQKIQKKINPKFQLYQNSDILVQDLLDSKINVILIEDSILSLMVEEMSELNTSFKIIETFKVKAKVKSTLKDVDVTKKPFAIYISGIDTYGEISSVSRSDVNIVMIVNPKIHQILLISIPRDYYVQLHGTTGTKDKLTHAGIYGIDMSIHTIEDLLDLNINYYVKVNFTSVIDIVDALGGLDVYSDYSFTSYSNFKFKKGLNSVNGEQALDFARTRKAFTDGDRQRGKNQQAVIEAIIRKASSKKIITKYNSLLNAINGKYQTNMSMKKITSLIKMQLNDMSAWTVTSYSLTGSDSSNYTYTYNQLLYVMEPDQKSIDEAISLIQSVMNNETLENSYNNISGDSNKVTKAYNSEQSSINKASSSDNLKNDNQSTIDDKKQDSNIKNIDKNVIEQEPKDKSSQNNNNSQETLDDESILSPIIPQQYNENITEDSLTTEVTQQILGE